MYSEQSERLKKPIKKSKMICNRERNSQNQTNGRMEQSQRIEQNLFRRILLVALHETIKN